MLDDSTALDPIPESHAKGRLRGSSVRFVVMSGQIIVHYKVVEKLGDVPLVPRCGTDETLSQSKVETL